MLINSCSHFKTSIHEHGNNTVHKTHRTREFHFSEKMLRNHPMMLTTLLTERWFSIQGRQWESSAAVFCSGSSFNDQKTTICDVKKSEAVICFPTRLKRSRSNRKEQQSGSNQKSPSSGRNVAPFLLDGLIRLLALHCKTWQAFAWMRLAKAVVGSRSSGTRGDLNPNFPDTRVDFNS